jgi:hypothetical protein
LKAAIAAYRCSTWYLPLPEHCSQLCLPLLLLHCLHLHLVHLRTMPSGLKQNPCDANGKRRRDKCLLDRTHAGFKPSKSRRSNPTPSSGAQRTCSTNGHRIVHRALMGLLEREEHRTVHRVV